MKGEPYMFTHNLVKLHGKDVCFWACRSFVDLHMVKRNYVQKPMELTEVKMRSRCKCVSCAAHKFSDAMSIDLAQLLVTSQRTVYYKCRQNSARGLKPPWW